jgi:hypothetical protein
MIAATVLAIWLAIVLGFAIDMVARARSGTLRAIIYLTEQPPESTSQTGYEPYEIEVTPEMIQAGVAAYAHEASHDEMSFARRRAD